MAKEARIEIPDYWADMKWDTPSRMTDITVSIDKDVKKDAEILFDKLGFTLSGAVEVFFRQAVREQGMPFEIRCISGNSEGSPMRCADKEILRILRDAEECTSID